MSTRAPIRHVAARRETSETTIRIPSAYREGFSAARALDPAQAEAYVRHTTVGDPHADAVAEDLASLSPDQVHSLLARAFLDPASPPRDLPESLRSLVADSAILPDWFDADLARTASRAFLRNSDIVLAALVGGSIVEGFSTLISKSFRVRGRVTNMGVRRLKQNGLQLVEQYLPGGMNPGADGWRLSVRVRLVHAQSRHYLRRSEEWNREKYGMPISTAHVLLAGSAFSGRLMQHVATLGGDFTQEERDAYVHVWRYTGRLIGIPEPLIFHDESSAVRAFRLGSICEPEPDYDAIIMANSIVNSAPLVVGVTDIPKRRALARTVYQASRELIGDRLADKFLFPRNRRKVVPFLRLQNRSRRVRRKVFPRWGQRDRLAKFNALMNFVDLGSSEHSYRLPTAARDEESAEW